MTKCWAMRGCDDEMQSRCAHPTTFLDRCPTKCAFAECNMPQRELTTDPDMVFVPDVDRDQAIKEVCLFCSFFLRKGPRL